MHVVFFCLFVFTIIVPCSVYGRWTQIFIELQESMRTKGFGINDLLGPFIVKHSTNNTNHVFINM